MKSSISGPRPFPLGTFQDAKRGKAPRGEDPPFFSGWRSSIFLLVKSEFSTFLVGGILHFCWWFFFSLVKSFLLLAKVHRFFFAESSGWTVFSEVPLSRSDLTLQSFPRPLGRFVCQAQPLWPWGRPDHDASDIVSGRSPVPNAGILHKFGAQFSWIFPDRFINRWIFEGVMDQQKITHPMVPTFPSNFFLHFSDNLFLHTFQPFSTFKKHIKT